MPRTVTPPWAKEILRELSSLHRKVNLLMALDSTLLNRILAGAQSLVEQAKAAAAREQGYKDQIAQLQGQVQSDQATIAADQASDDSANQALSQTADALDQLLSGPETPVVQTPAPTDAPDVISGNTDPVVVSDTPASNDSVDGGSSDSSFDNSGQLV